MIQYREDRRQGKRPTQKKKNVGLYQARRYSSRTFVCHTPAQTAGVAARLLAAPVKVWLLRGQLGSGKSTFVRGALRALGYSGPAASPTFTLSRTYRLRSSPWRSLVHVDAYRIRRASEEAALNLEPAVHDLRTLVFIEWPERLKNHPWRGAGEVSFSYWGRGRRLVARWPV